MRLITLCFVTLRLTPPPPDAAGFIVLVFFFTLASRAAIAPATLDLAAPLPPFRPPFLLLPRPAAPPRPRPRPRPPPLSRWAASWSPSSPSASGLPPERSTVRGWEQVGHSTSPGAASISS